LTNNDFDMFYFFTRLEFSYDIISFVAKGLFGLEAHCFNSQILKQVTLLL